MSTNIEEINEMIEELKSLTEEIYTDAAALISKKSVIEQKKLDLYSKTIELMVELSTPKIVSTIEISPVSADIKVNETLQMNAVCKDKNGDIMECPVLSWKSSNPNVAIVDKNGIVSTVASSGFTDITATYP